MSCHISRGKKIGQYICGIYVESFPHHLLNKFFLFLERARTGAAICSGRVIVPETTVQQLMVLFSGAWWG